MFSIFYTSRLANLFYTIPNKIYRIFGLHLNLWHSETQGLDNSIRENFLDTSKSILNFFIEIQWISQEFYTKDRLNESMQRYSWTFAFSIINHVIFSQAITSTRLCNLFKDIHADTKSPNDLTIRYIFKSKSLRMQLYYIFLHWIVLKEFIQRNEYRMPFNK